MPRELSVPATSSDTNGDTAAWQTLTLDGLLHLSEPDCSALLEFLVFVFDVLNGGKDVVQRLVQLRQL